MDTMDTMEGEIIETRNERRVSSEKRRVKRFSAPINGVVRQSLEGLDVRKFCTESLVG